MMTIGESIPCACGGECCCTVPVSPEEVQGILEATGGSFEDYFLTTNAGTYTRAKVIPSPPEVVISRCCLFDHLRCFCTVYEARPSICREYDCRA